MTSIAPLKILEISAGARSEGSISRLLTADLIQALESRYSATETKFRLSMRRGSRQTSRLTRTGPGSMSKPSPIPTNWFPSLRRPISW